MLGSWEASLPAYQHSSILAFKQYAILEPGVVIVDRFAIGLKHARKNQSWRTIDNFQFLDSRKAFKWAITSSLTFWEKLSPV